MCSISDETQPSKKKGGGGETPYNQNKTQKTPHPSKTPLHLVATVCKKPTIFFHFEQIVHFCSEHTENIFFVLLLTSSLEFNWEVDNEACRDNP